MCQISYLSSASSRTWPTGACEGRIVRQTNGATRNPRIHLNQAQTENDRLRNSTTNDHRRSLCTISVAFHSRSTRLDRPPTVYDSTRPSMTKHVAPLLPRFPFACSINFYADSYVCTSSRSLPGTRLQFYYSCLLTFTGYVSRKKSLEMVIEIILRNIILCLEYNKGNYLMECKTV